MQKIKAVHWAILLSFSLGLNLVASDDKEGSLDGEFIVKESRYPWFEEQQELDIIESMAASAIKKNSLEWALIAYDNLRDCIFINSNKKLAYMHYFVSGVNICHFYNNRVKNSYMSVLHGAAASLGCLLGTLLLVDVMQKNNIEKMIINYLKHTSYPEKLNIIEELKCSNADFDVLKLFDEYEFLDKKAIESYYETKDLIKKKYQDKYRNFWGK